MIWSWPKEGEFRRLLKTSLHNMRLLSADSLYTCSNFVKERIARKSCYPRNKITVITHGIDIDKFTCTPTQSDVHDRVKIVTIARAVRYKGVHTLIRATKLLRDKYALTNFSVEYGGDGPEIQEFKELVETLGIRDLFSFLGHLQDTKDTICNADIVVVPSAWGDAFPLGVLEAMVAGKALVTTNVGGIPEQTGDEGCAVLIPHSDAEALAKELAILVRDQAKRASLGCKARKRAEKMFREDKFHERVVTRLLADFNLDKIRS